MAGLSPGLSDILRTARLVGLVEMDFLRLGVVSAMRLFRIMVAGEMLVERREDRTLRRELARESARELARDSARELAREPARELARESAREFARESARELARELISELAKEFLREFVSCTAMREPGREVGPREVGLLV